ncbi:hypothetical protein ACTXT7_007547 [Hymenolepis weldensis]
MEIYDFLMINSQLRRENIYRPPPPPCLYTVPILSPNPVAIESVCNLILRVGSFNIKRSLYAINSHLQFPTNWQSCYPTFGPYTIAVSTYIQRLQPPLIPLFLIEALTQINFLSFLSTCTSATEEPPVLSN